MLSGTGGSGPVGSGEWSEWIELHANFSCTVQYWGLSFTSTPCLKKSLWGNNRAERIHKTILCHYRLEQQHGSVSPITGNAQGRGRRYVAAVGVC